MRSRTSTSSLFGRLAGVACTVILGVGLTLCGAVPAQAAQNCAVDGGADFAEKTPTVAELNRVSLRCADFRNATLNHIDFGQADLAGADFRSATVTRSDFSQATLTDADFADATLTGTSFEQATMRGVDLTHIHGSRADFEQVNLDGVSLTGADLHNADLSQASLKRANLSDANLRGASLDQADLTGANLHRANIAGIDLSEATTTDADSTGVVGLSPLDLFSAIIVLVVALLALRPRLSGKKGGRGGAWLVVLIIAALTAVQAVAALGWEPTGDELFVLPFLTPVIFIALFVARIIRRPKDGWPGAAIALVALIGLYLVVTAGLAALVDNVFGILPLTDTCSSISCGYGVARGVQGVAVGIGLIVLAAILSRLKVLAKPAPNLAQWNAMQTADSALFAQGRTSSGAGFTTGSTDDRPPSQTI